MALITIPSSPEKGTVQQYALNTTDLIALVSDSYFQNQANWSKVVVLYESAESNQLEVINFIPDGSSELFQDVQFSSFARDLFGVHSITIFDNQNGRYQIRASEIPGVASYEISFSSVPAIGARYSTTLKSVDLTVTGDGKILSPADSISAPIISWGYVETYLSTASGKYAIQFQASEATNAQTYIFTSNLSSDPTSFSDGASPGGGMLNNGKGFYLEEDDQTIRRTQDYGIIYSDAGIGWQPGDKVTLAIDMDAKRLYVAINNVWSGSMNPSAGTGGVDITDLLSEPRLYFAAGVNTGAVSIIPVEDLPSGYFQVGEALQPSNVFSSLLASSDITVSNDGLTIERTSVDTGFSYISALTDRSFDLTSTEKIYFEIQVNRSGLTTNEAMGIVFQTGVPTQFGSNSSPLPGYFGIQGPRAYIQNQGIYKQNETQLTGDYLEQFSVFWGNGFIGIAVDIAARTFFFVNASLEPESPGFTSSQFSFADIIGSATRFYLAVGAATPLDSFTKVTSSNKVPAGYTLV
jgi:hypothetical protein